MQEIKLAIPHYGYRIETRKRIIDRDITPDVLTAAKQQKISYAVLGDNNVMIVQHAVVCSSCGHGVPAYHKFIGHTEGNLEIKTRSEIEAWSTRQLSLFGEPPKVLHFNDPISETAHFVCPRCGASLNPSKYKLHVMIRANKNKIKIMRGLNLKDYFSIKWIEQFEISEFDLYETITFNLGNGHTYISLENEAGEKCAVRDISNDDVTDMTDDPIFELIRIYKPVYRKLKRFFGKFWNGALPFSPHELNLEKYILLTKFVGFDRDFYNAIPFSNAENCIEQSFAGIAKQLHNANKVPTIFEASQLPNMKSVRKIVFSNPALLFYRKELEVFWKILKDPNFFRTFLESRNLFRELSILHKYPGIRDFYKELSAAVGQKALCNSLSKGNAVVHSYALKYLMLNDYEKKMERKKWAGSFLSKMSNCEMASLGSAASVPIFPPNGDTDDLECRIGDYSFTRLCNSKEYMSAGKELRNCLKNWDWFDGNVYGISKNSKYVAAVEMQDKVIIQAHTYRNGEMNQDPTLFSAFCLWKERKGLTEYDGNDAENGE